MPCGSAGFRISLPDLLRRREPAVAVPGLMEKFSFEFHPSDRRRQLPRLPRWHSRPLHEAHHLPLSSANAGLRASSIT